MKSPSIKCDRCGQDLTKPVSFFGEKAAREIHEAAHRREDLRKRLELIKTDVLNRDREDAIQKLDALIEPLK